MAAAVIAHRRGWRNLVSMSIQVREMSELVQQNANGRKAFLVDTLSMVRKLEGQGIPSKHAEVITSALTEVVNDSMENVSQSFVSNGKMKMSEKVQDFNLSKFKSEIQTLLEHHFSSIKCETDEVRDDIEKISKEHKSDIEKMSKEFTLGIEKIQTTLKYEKDMLASNQRLELNSERRQTSEDLIKQWDKFFEITEKLNQENNDLKVQLANAKNNVIKYCIGTFFSLVATSFAIFSALK